MPAACSILGIDLAGVEVNSRSPSLTLAPSSKWDRDDGGFQP